MTRAATTTTTLELDARIRKGVTKCCLHLSREFQQECGEEARPFQNDMHGLIDALREYSRHAFVVKALRLNAFRNDYALSGDRLWSVLRHVKCHYTPSDV